METGAGERIRAAFDPELFATLGGRMVEQLTAHLRSIQGGETAVLNWNTPAENIAVANSLLNGVDGNQKTPLDSFTAAVQTILDRGQNLHHPRYVGHQVPASVPIAGLFDAVGAVTNQVMAIYEMGPFASSVEVAMVERLGAEVGLTPGEFTGFVTHGGSLANLTSLLTARNVALPNSWQTGIPQDCSPVLVSHAEAHYCIARSAGILGLGTDQVVKAALDDRRRMDPNRLDEQLTALKRDGRPVIAVAACACATPIGAFDPLEDIADVCEKHGVWMHVDAAHGGAAAFSAKYGHLVRGLHRADSFIWDAHKMLFVPALSAFVFYRNREHRFAAFQQNAPYLFDPTQGDIAEYDSGLKTIECTKRSAALGLWGLWSVFGRQLFADLVDTTFDLGRTFYEMLVEAPDFEPLHEPECNIVAFRHVPDSLRSASPKVLGDFNLRLRRDVMESGRFYLVPTASDGIGALRVTIINPLTTPEHLTELLETLRSNGQQLLSTT